ncbi:MAG: methyltransferase, TIGR04325 family [Lachnospiraceae bacterium]|nr:methyltransferase, TIGR04325 family [Lachnospiraceae bacterium]
MFLQEKIRDINMRLKELKDYSNIVVWGAGKHVCELFEKTEMLSYQIRDIVHTNENICGSFFFGYIIKAPEDIDWNNIDAVILSAPNMKKVTNTLRNEIGFSGKIVSLYSTNEKTPFYLLYDEGLSQICYLGEYDNWEDGLRDCKGYDDDLILDKVSSAVEKVIDGSAVWERDSCLFYEPKYVHRICAMILKCAVQNDNQSVRILDVGGSLGSTYFQNRDFLKDVQNLEYVIAEQENYAIYGHKNLENGVLQFINSSEDFAEHGVFDIVMLLGSLQYIKQYEEILLKIKKMKPRYIIIDRIMVGKRARICKQMVPESLYKSSYPVRIFVESEIEVFFGNEYVIIERDVSSVPENAYFMDGQADSRYYVFERKFDI